MTARSKPVARLDDHLGYWLRFVSNHVSHAFKLKVEARGVTVAEWVVMRALFDGGDEGADVNPSQVADQLGMTRGAVSKLVDRLVAKKLVRTRISRSDRRYQAIALTPTGGALVPELAALADQNDAEFFGHLSAAERAGLADALKEIVRRRGLVAVPVE